jgi:hypothetical protein
VGFETVGGSACRRIVNFLTARSAWNAASPHTAIKLMNKLASDPYDTTNINAFKKICTVYSGYH